MIAVIRNGDRCGCADGKPVFFGNGGGDFVDRGSDGNDGGVGVDGVALLIVVVAAMWWWNSW